MSNYVKNSIINYQFDADSARKISSIRNNSQSNIEDYLYKIQSACLEGKRECFLFYPKDNEIEEIQKRGFDIQIRILNDKEHTFVVW